MKNSDVAMIGKARYKRNPRDFYETPLWCTEALCNNVKLRGPIWEPAAGGGAIVRVFESRGFLVYATDISGPQKIDFRRSDIFAGAETIATNPPNRLAETFIRQALKLTKPRRGMVAMFLRNEYDCASTRVDLFEGPPFARKLVLTKRPKWIEGPLRASPRHNFSWFVWDWLHKGPATIGYGQ